MASKKRLSALPANWQEKLMMHAREKYRKQMKACKEDPRLTKPTYLYPLAVLEGTGCRPSELAKGVKFRKVMEGGQVAGFEFVIEGAKCRTSEITRLVDKKDGSTEKIAFKTGIEERTVYVRLASKMHMACPEWQRVLLKVEDGTIKTSSAATIHTQMARLCDDLWNRSNVATPTPYSYRHSVAKALKTAEATPVMIARVMGHRSTRTQQRYGSKTKGGSEGPQTLVEKKKGRLMSATTTADASIRSRPSKPLPAANTMAGFKRASAMKKKAAVSSPSASKSKGLKI